MDWELIGIFDSREKAIAACKEYFDFIAPIELNAIAPRERTVMPNYEFPLAEV